MKKMFALLITLTLLLGALAVPSLAEDAGQSADQTTSATTQVGKGGRGNPRQIPGGNGRMPQMPGQDSGNSQLPRMPDQNNANGQITGPNNRNMKRGNTSGTQDGAASGSQAGRHGKQMIFDRLLANGVITQEIYDAIMAYMKEQAPQQAAAGSVPADTTAPAGESEPPALPDGTAPADSSEPPALPDGTAPADSSEPPALPDGATPADSSEPPALPDGSLGEPDTMEQQLLKNLLDSGVITQEQYDLLLTKITSSAV